MERTKGIIKPERPAGFPDYNTRTYLIRESIINKINKIFRSYGYNPIETPVVEFLKVLIGEDETSKNIFSVKSFSSSYQEEIALRFDHTVPFARFLAANPYNKAKKIGIKLPWRRSVYGPVFRSDQPQKGRFRQFYQFDVDIAGVDSMLADSEIVLIIYEVLKLLLEDNFTIKINNRKILNGFTDLLDIKDRGRVSALDITKEIMRILDKIQKYPWNQIRSELQAIPVNDFDPSPNLTDESLSKVENFLNIEGSNEEKLRQCKTLFYGINIALEGIDEISLLLHYLSLQKIDFKKIKVDFSIARGLDYYTGPVFESFVNTSSEYGSIFSGGRYDGLTTRFTGQKLSAVGASIGIDRLLAIMEDLNQSIDLSNNSANLIILRLSDKPEFISQYFEIANIFRKKGLNVELSLLSNTSFKAQFNFAVSQDYQFVLILGENEYKNQVCIIKDLKKRTQEIVKLSEIDLLFNI